MVRRKTVQRKKVVSSNIKSVGYDVKTHTLEVAFNSGGVYNYFQVSPSMYKALMQADSKGKYLNEHIKGTHRFEKVG
jgi:hypothetical protein